MPFQACAYEGPSVIWNTDVFDDYESALLEAAKYMYEESLDFGGNPYMSIEFLADAFDDLDIYDLDEKKDEETYVQWIQRVVDANLSEEDLPDPNSGQDLHLIEVDGDRDKTIQAWSGTTIFHPVKGLCTVWHPDDPEDRNPLLALIPELATSLEKAGRSLNIPRLIILQAALQLGVPLAIAELTAQAQAKE